MKSYRTIFRIDYPLCFKLIDGMGTYLEFIHEFTRMHFVEYSSNIDPNKRNISSTGKTDTLSYNFTLNLTSIFVIIDNFKGITISDIDANNKVFELFESVFNRINAQDGFSRFTRLGFRSWILAEDHGLEFKTIFDKLCNDNECFTDAISGSFSKPNDIMLCYESSNEAKQNMRINFGPYKQEEYPKYFAKDPEINEALILDIDVWENSLEIPNMDIHSLLASRQNVSKIIAGDMIAALKSREDG